MIAISIAIMLAVGANVNGQTDPCLINNGGCSDQCSWLGGNNVANCYCPCGKIVNPLNSNECVPGPPCNVDIYVAVDRSNGPFDCALAEDPNYVTFRGFNVDFLRSLETLEKPTYNVGLQEYFSAEGGFRNLTTYGGNLTAGIALYEATTNTISPCSSSCVFEPLINSIENNRNIPSFMYRGPGLSRPKDSTTRIAIITTSGLQSVLSGGLAGVASLLVDTYLHYDGIIIIGWQRFINAADLEKIQFAACRNSTTPCNQVFYFDQTNSAGMALSLSNVLAAVNTDACLTRRPLAQVMTQCTPRMEVIIPKCRLLGLSLSQLQLFDPSCAVTGTDNGDSYTIELDYVTCGVVFQEVGSFGIYYQRVSTRLVSGQTLPIVEFNVTCAYNLVIPAPPVNKNISGNSDLSSEAAKFSFALDENFTSPLAPGSCVEVDCPLYFKVEAILPPEVSLRVTSCYASPYQNALNSSIDYELAKDSCPADPTFRFLNSSDNSVALFTFTMFEFAKSFFEKNENKLKVYLYCYLVACAPDDTTQSCDPTCSTSARRRRSSDDLYPTSIGSFYVERKKTNKAKPENQKVEILLEENNQNTINPWLLGLLLLVLMLWGGALYWNSSPSHLAGLMRDPPPYYDASNHIDGCIKKEQPETEENTE